MTRPTTAPSTATYSTRVDVAFAMRDMSRELRKSSENACEELLKHLSQEDITSPKQLLRLLAVCQRTCQDLLLCEPKYAPAKDVDSYLWAIHGRINSKYRTKLQECRGGKKHVEHRKIGRDFIAFIKLSQRFYRGHIEALASYHGFLGDLKDITATLSLGNTSIQNTNGDKDQLHHAIIVSCHQTLIRLGDLSRWRETQYGAKRHNWEPAINYYELAKSLDIRSGASYNQLAVITSVDADHLGTLYHLYRALVTGDPHPGALGNLTIEINKFCDSQKHSKAVNLDNTGPDSLVDCFLRLHTCCLERADLSKFDEIWADFFVKLQCSLREHSQEEFLRKVVLISIAAEHIAGIRLQDEPSSVEIRQSFMMLQGVNIHIFTTLLMILQSDEGIVRTSEQASRASLYGDSTSTAYRVLPVLRHYSSWLAVNAPILGAAIENPRLAAQKKQLWTTYADTLSALASRFSADELEISRDYLLEEDVDTLSFMPFFHGESHENIRQRYFDDTQKMKKPYFHCRIRRQHVRAEMLSRIADILTDGMTLILEHEIPIQLIPGTTRFVNILEDTPSPATVPTSMPTSFVPQQGNVTHVDETILPKATEGGVFPRVDAVWSSCTTDDAHCPSKEAENLVEKRVVPCDCSQCSIKVTGDETSYGLLGSGSLNEYLCNNHLPASIPQKICLSDKDAIGTAQQPKPIDLITVSSTPSSIPAPTAIESLPCSIQDPAIKAREVQKVLDASAFMSSNISAGSTWGFPSDIGSTNANDIPSQPPLGTS